MNKWRKYSKKIDHKIRDARVEHRACGQLDEEASDRARRCQRLNILKNLGQATKRPGQRAKDPYGKAQCVTIRVASRETSKKKSEKFAKLPPGLVA